MTSDRGPLPTQPTRSWHGERALGRLRIGWHIYLHRYPTLPDRWVFSPTFKYDRKLVGPSRPTKARTVVHRG